MAVIEGLNDTEPISQAPKVSIVIKLYRDRSLSELAIETKTQAFWDMTTAEVKLSIKISCTIP